jgi:hypothetical protein
MQSELGSLRQEISRARNDLAFFLLDKGADLFLLPCGRVLRLTESCSCLTITPDVLMKTCRALVDSIAGAPPRSQVFVEHVAFAHLRRFVQKKAQHGDIFLPGDKSAKKQGRGQKIVVGNADELPTWVIDRATTLWSAKARVAGMKKPVRESIAESLDHSLDVQLPKSGDNLIAPQLPQDPFPEKACVTKVRHRPWKLSQADVLLVTLIKDVMTNGSGEFLLWEQFCGELEATIRTAMR